MFKWSGMCSLRHRHAHTKVKNRFVSRGRLWIEDLRYTICMHIRLVFTPNGKWSQHNSTPQHKNMFYDTLVKYQIPLCRLDCRIRWLHLCRGVRYLSECPGCDTKPSDGEVLVIDLLGKWSTLSLPLLSFQRRLLFAVGGKPLCSRTGLW